MARLACKNFAPAALASHVLDVWQFHTIVVALAARGKFLLEVQAFPGSLGFPVRL